MDALEVILVSYASSLRIWFHKAFRYCYLLYVSVGVLKQMNISAQVHHHKFLWHNQVGHRTVVKKGGYLNPYNIPQIMAQVLGVHIRHTLKRYASCRQGYTSKRSSH